MEQQTFDLSVSTETLLIELAKKSAERSEASSAAGVWRQKCGELDKNIAEIVGVLSQRGLELSTPKQLDFASAPRESREVAFDGKTGAPIAAETPSGKWPLTPSEDDPDYCVCDYDIHAGPGEEHDEVHGKFVASSDEKDDEATIAAAPKKRGRPKAAVVDMTAAVSARAKRGARA